MSYLPQLRGELVRAAAGRPEFAAAVANRSEVGVVAGATPNPPEVGVVARAALPRGWRALRVRWLGARGPRLRWVAINLAIGLAGTVGGLSAAGVFDRGTPLGPSVAPAPHTAEGVAVPGSAHLLPLRTPDPDGGLPWGLRVVRTTRGLECVDVARVDYGTIGVLGQDGAFHGDGRFHPVSPDIFGVLGCATRDARGHAFVNVALQNQPASGLEGLSQAGDSRGCEPAELPHRHHLPACPQADMREIYLGLLGPDARSVTYRLPSGGQRTVATVGTQGAYLIVLPQATSGCLAPARPWETPASHCAYGGRGNRGGEPEVPSGAISAVTYRDGRVCRVAAPGTWRSMFGSCPPVGFVEPRTHIPTHAQLAAPLTVRALPARHYCAQLHGEKVMPCERGVPAGYKRLDGGWPALLVQVEFTARVAITGSNSWYEIEVHYAHSHSCPGGGDFGPTDYDIRAGQRVHYRTFVPYRCHGLAHVTVAYVPTVGPAGSMPVTGLPGQGKPVLVGAVALRVPRAPG